MGPHQRIVQALTARGITVQIDVHGHRHRCGVLPQAATASTNIDSSQLAAPRALPLMHPEQPRLRRQKRRPRLRKRRSGLCRRHISNSRSDRIDRLPGRRSEMENCEVVALLQRDRPRLDPAQRPALIVRTGPDPQRSPAARIKEDGKTIVAVDDSPDQRELRPLQWARLLGDRCSSDDRRRLIGRRRASRR